MEEYIYKNTNSLSKELCNDLIKMFEEESDKYEGVTYSGLNKNIKDTTDFVIPVNNKKWNKINNLLNREIQNNIKLYLDGLNNKIDFENANQNTKNKYKIFQDTKFLHKNYMIQKYLKGKGKYVYHNDSQINLQEKSYRAITYLWYLNDVEEGGETVFFGENKIKPKTGQLIFFLLHGAILIQVKCLYQVINI